MAVVFGLASVVNDGIVTTPVSATTTGIWVGGDGVPPLVAVACSGASDHFVFVMAVVFALVIIVNEAIGTSHNSATTTGIWVGGSDGYGIVGYVGMEAVSYPNSAV